MATLSFDEMEVRRCYDYNCESDSVMGPFKKLQLVMVRGLCLSWKQPIYFQFDTQMKKDLLFQIIISVEKSGIQVWTIVFDLGNVGILKSLGVTPEHPFFPNPFDPSRPVFVVPDTPHMLKLLRNHLLDDTYVIDDNHKICYKDLEDIIRQDNCEFKI